MVDIDYVRAWLWIFSKRWNSRIDDSKRYDSRSVCISLREIPEANSQDPSMPTELEVVKSPRVPRYRPCRRRLRSWLDFTEHDRARSPLHARESLSMLCLSDRSLCSRHRLPVNVTLGFIFFYKRLENRKEGGKQTTWKARPLLFPSRHRNMADRLTVSVPRQWLVDRLSQSASAQKITMIRLEISFRDSSLAIKLTRQLE